jgi:hypothetical protein
MANSILLVNRYVEATEPSSDDHRGCDVFSDKCEIGDPSPHLRLSAIARGEKLKSGIKVSNPTIEEVRALVDDCKWQVYFTSAEHLQEDYKYHYSIHYSLKRMFEKLKQLQTELEAAQ